MKIYTQIGSEFSKTGFDDLPLTIAYTSAHTFPLLPLSVQPAKSSPYHTFNFSPAVTWIGWLTQGVMYMQCITSHHYQKKVNNFWFCSIDKNESKSVVFQQKKMFDISFIPNKFIGFCGHDKRELG